MPWTLGDTVHVTSLHATNDLHIDGDPVSTDILETSVTNLTSQLTAKANLAEPTFTGDVNINLPAGNTPPTATYSFDFTGGSALAGTTHENGTPTYSSAGVTTGPASNVKVSGAFILPSAFSVEWYGTLIAQAQDQRPWGMYTTGVSTTNVFLARKGNDSDKLRFGFPTGQNAIISDSIAQTGLKTRKCEKSRTKFGGAPAFNTLLLGPYGEPNSTDSIAQNGRTTRTM